jgi:hypothetical protein
MGFLPHTLLVWIQQIPVVQILIVGPVGPIEGAFITFEHNSDLFQTDVLGRCDIANPLVDSKFAVASEGYCQLRMGSSFGRGAKLCKLPCSDCTGMGTKWAFF